MEKDMFSSRASKAFQEFLDSEYEGENDRLQLIKKHENNIIQQALTNLNLTHYFSENEKNRFMQELNEIIYFIGNEVPLFSDNNYLPITPNISAEEKIIIQAKNFLRYLLVGAPFQYSAFLQGPIYDALTKKNDPYIAAIMRIEFQAMLNHIDLNVLEKLNEQGRRHFDMQLANLLALFTFFEPENEPENSRYIVIPQFSNGVWQKVQFKIQLIELKPNKNHDALYADENGAVRDPKYVMYAYGLVAENASPYLLFRGTPHEPAKGYLFAVLDDFADGQSVGEGIYNANRDRIHAWIKDETYEGKFKLRVTGQSLGGSLSLLLALNMPQYLDTVLAFNAPGIDEKTLKNPLFSVWDNTPYAQKPNVIVQMQQYDLVKFIGSWKNDWTLVKVFPIKHEMILQTYLAHIRSFPNQPGSLGLLVNPVADNQLTRRKVWTKIKSGMLNPLFTFFITRKISSNNDDKKESLAASSAATKPGN